MAGILGSHPVEVGYILIISKRIIYFGMVSKKKKKGNWSRSLNKKKPSLEDHFHFLDLH